MGNSLQSTDNRLGLRDCGDVPGPHRPDQASTGLTADFQEDIVDIHTNPAEPGPDTMVRYPEESGNAHGLFGLHPRIKAHGLSVLNLNFMFEHPGLVFPLTLQPDLVRHPGLEPEPARLTPPHDPVSHIIDGKIDPGDRRCLGKRDIDMSTGLCAITVLDLGHEDDPLGTRARLDPLEFFAYIDPAIPGPGHPKEIA